MRKPRKQYAPATKELMVQAISDYRTSPLSIRQVATKYNLCRGRLHRAILDTEQHPERYTELPAYQRPTDALARRPRSQDSQLQSDAILKAIGALHVEVTKTFGRFLDFSVIMRDLVRDVEYRLNQVELVAKQEQPTDRKAG